MTQAGPWRIRLWVICAGGKAYDYRFGRSTAYKACAVWRARKPKWRWTVRAFTASLILEG